MKIDIHAHCDSAKAGSVEAREQTGRGILAWH